MINPRISAVWSTTKQIEPFSCTSRVQEEHTKLSLYTLPLVSEPFSCTPRVQEVHTKAYTLPLVS